MRLIDLLLRLYPQEFRARFGRQMSDFHEQRVREGGHWLPVIRDHVATAAAEQVRAVRPDAAFALRGMARRPGFATVIVLTIALGVGANAAIFSVVNAVLLRPLPYPAADRIFTMGHEPPTWLVSAPQYAFYRRNMRTVQELAAYTRGENNLMAVDATERIATAAVTLNFFRALGVAPRIGRTFAEGEDIVRPSDVVVISDGLWERRFGRDPAVVGKSLVLNNRSRMVIGVMPPEFSYPVRETQVWLPLCTQRSCASFQTLVPDSLDGWWTHYLSVVGRLDPRFTVDQARDEAVSLSGRIMQENAPDAANPLVPKLRRLREDMVGATRPYLLVMLGAVGFVLLIACANVANLLLARGESRRREMALRAAIGASRRRLATLLLTESLVLALAGGMLGLALGWAGTRALVAMAPATLPQLDQVRVDWLVLGFGLAVSTLAGLLFGVLPAIRASREAPAESLRAAGKGHGPSGAAASGRARRALVTGEIAVAMVLLSGAGMLVRSLLLIQQTDLGFRPDGALTAVISPTAGAYTDAQAVSFHERLIERVRAMPGVRAVGSARWLPVVGAGGMWDIVVEGRPSPSGLAPTAVPEEVTPEYFTAVGSRIVAGRGLTAQDREDAPRVVVVNETFARTIWPNENALGRRFRLGGLDTAWMTVVGIVEDIRARGYADTPEPSWYIPLAQTPGSNYFVPRSMALVVRADVDPLTLANPVRSAVRALDPAVAVSDVRTLEAVVGTSTAERRFSTALIAGFAALALLLAGVGIYGVISYSVSERAFEIGVRMALGADRSRVLGLVVADGARMTLAGLLIGMLGSVALANFMRSLLFGLSAVDLGTLLPVSMLLGGVALLASIVPARRAATVNPTEALRGG